MLSCYVVIIITTTVKLVKYFFISSVEILNLLVKTYQFHVHRWQRRKIEANSLQRDETIMPSPPSSLARSAPCWPRPLTVGGAGWWSPPPSSSPCWWTASASAWASSSTPFANTSKPPTPKLPGWGRHSTELT